MKINDKYTGVYKTSNHNSVGMNNFFNDISNEVWARVHNRDYRNNYFGVIRNNIGRTCVYSMVRGVLNKKETYEN